MKKARTLAHWNVFRLFCRFLLILRFFVYRSTIRNSANNGSASNASGDRTKYCLFLLLPNCCLILLICCSSPVRNLFLEERSNEEEENSEEGDGLGATSTCAQWLR
ncbi:uncharacterized protein MONOS_9032 [Monocercomonoides exilis]|uniref:uncharacterized protein n=1 Tax=Monocercomonoides exilis TaxID=2049356 RepID=UPI00355AABAE|nr:hypothetical protein MONOS_9032 [Monocercomonoides exilis]|eukprot:MONOS_9032.1-p1 / transcript=MONOS_9032.1 / gene=MONOS_9032 / organism=Monocercomonoides_exilis_PA203 / gene_product=unspecified product / transcript_product=unspecified product / location=Mono_scaffold00359:3212-3676(+) / protein_length=106 / sequence_SO=supercontig / SO=protein_coding / is_pseudo=false